MRLGLNLPPNPSLNFPTIWKNIKLSHWHFCHLCPFQKLVEQFMTEDIQIGGTADEKLQSQLYIGK